MSGKPVIFDYYSDILCVWAYFAQIRVDELQLEFGDNIQLNYHFINLFGNNHKRIAEGWSDGGYQGYANYIKDTCNAFPHVSVHPDIWTHNTPPCSMPAHIAIKAAQLIAANPAIIKKFIWNLRLAFFRDNKNIATESEWQSIAEKSDLSLTEMNELISSGEAHAALALDLQDQQEKSIEGSPTYIMNEGRQKLYGNLGYRAISANVQELLDHPMNIPAWC